MDGNQIAQRRQVLYWRLLTAMFGYTEQGANFERMSRAIADELSLPQLILDPNVSIENLLQRYPELEQDFTQAVVAEIANKTVGGRESFSDISYLFFQCFHLGMLTRRLRLPIQGYNDQTYLRAIFMLKTT